jgi:phenylacetate-CoA ligase
MGIEPGDGIAKLWGYGADQRWGNRIGWATGRLFFDAFDLSTEAMDRWIVHLKRVAPALLYGYAGALARFARHVELRGESLPGLRVVASTAENLHAEQRATIERALGVPVRDLYGSHEVPRIAQECDHGSMHLFLDTAVVEFVPGIDPDSPQRMLVTSLDGFAQPLIRYDIGDTGRLLDGDCPCGWPLPRIAFGVGKEHRLFWFSSGESVHTVTFFKRLYPIDGLEAFQVHHADRDRVEIRVARRPGRTDASAAVERAASEIRRQLPYGVALTVRWVDDIPTSPRGKRPLFTTSVSEDDSTEHH